MNSNMGADKPTILATGLSGLVGSTVASLLSSSFQFSSIGRSTGVAIQRYNQVDKAIGASDAKIVLHLAAKTDVDDCEKDKEPDMTKLGNNEIEQIDIESLDSTKWQDSDSCFAVNVIGTLNVARACQKYGKKLVYVSTDFVFDGNKDGAYTEDDSPHPINFYGQTKYLGEKIVQKLVSGSLIVRISYPYATVSHLVKQDFVHKIASRLSKNLDVQAVTDSQFTPTLIEDIASGIKTLITKDVNGIIHLVGSQTLSPYQSALALAKHFSYDTSLIKKITMVKFYQNRATRPCNGAIKSLKLGVLGIVMNSFEQGLKKITNI